MELCVDNTSSFDSPINISICEPGDRYRGSFDQAAVGILHTSLDGRILKCNRRFGEMLGYEPEELIGTSFQDITIPEDQKSGRTAALRLLKGDVPNISFEKRYVRKNGSFTWAMLTISIQRDEHGHPLFFLTVALDINDRKAAQARLASAQEALRVSEERYRTAFQMSLDSIHISRIGDGTFIDCNQAYLDVTGFTREEIIGQSSIELGIWVDLEDRRKLMDQIRTDGVCRDFEAKFRKKSGEVFWGSCTASAMEIAGTPCVLAVTRDTSDAKSAQKEIRHLAFYDSLTELPNRRLLLEHLRQSVNTSRRTGRQRALLFIDLDNFKIVNDTLGHETGDLLLKEIGSRIKSCIRAGDTASRVGGDEFVVILEDLSQDQAQSASQAKVVAEKVLEHISRPCIVAGRECHTTASIGITIFRDCGESVAEILQQADIAMYQAKSVGRQTIRFFAPELQSAVNARAELEDELRRAIRSRQFLLWYQPQIESGTVVGAEALLRWNHPRRGILPPSDFISLAEETGLIIPLGNQVLEAACRQLHDWKRDPSVPSLSMAVNVSARQFRQADFVQQVLSTLKATGADPALLKLEITETMLLHNLEETISIMKALKAHGLQFSLDDFGTGYSSLTYLKRLPLDQLKIDRSFVHDLLADSTSSAIAEAIVSMSRAMDLSLLAEGVETEAQRAHLDRIGCHAFQGYLFSPPVPPERFQSILQQLATSA